MWKKIVKFADTILDDSESGEAFTHDCIEWQSDKGQFRIKVWNNFTLQALNNACVTAEIHPFDVRIIKSYDVWFITVDIEREV